MVKGRVVENSLDGCCRAADHSNEETVTEGKECEEEKPGCDLFLNSDNGKNGCNKAKGTGTGKNTIGKPPDLKTL